VSKYKSSFNLVFGLKIATTLNIRMLKTLVFAFLTSGVVLGQQVGPPGSIRRSPA
jgi:hypothetical protein